MVVREWNRKLRGYLYNEHNMFSMYLDSPAYDSVDVDCNICMYVCIYRVLHKCIENFKAGFLYKFFNWNLPYRVTVP